MFTLLQKAFPDGSLLPYLGFIVTVFSALRLAKFNLDERQTSDFIGLNTPMNTFYVLSLPYIAVEYPELIINPIFLICSVLLTSYLLISEIRLFSMKFSSMDWKTNKFRFIFLFLTLVLFIIGQFMALPVILLLYFILSALHFNKKNDLA
jgi:CDP-diacylglycerol--serine O-phosphatidyltransferase